MSRLLQVIIAIAGLAITIMLHLAAERSQEAQSRQTYVAQFTQTLAHAIATCNSTMIGLAIEAATEIDAINGDQTYFDRVTEVQSTCGNPEVQQQIAETAPAPTATLAPQDLRAEAPPTISRGAAQSRAPRTAESGRRDGSVLAMEPPAQLQVATRNLELQREEIVPRSIRNAASGGYYAVLASYGVRDQSSYDAERGASAHYNTLVDATRAAGINVRVFRTSVSDHFAIVLEPEGLTQENARALMARARREGWSPDAFVQQERGWVACDNPGTIEGLRACAPAARR
jgi:hypothetical protein